MKSLRSLALVPLVVLIGCVGVDYSREMQTAFEKTFKHTFTSYQFYGTPLSGYGVGTMYPKAAQNAEFDPTVSGIYGEPRTWWKDGMSIDEQQKRYSDLFGDADTGKVTLQYDRKTAFGLDVVLPALYQLLSANGSFDFKKHVTVSITADDAYNHRINWSIFQSDLQQGLIKDYVERHYEANDYLIVADDVVLLNYKATLNVDRNLSAGAQAQLKQAWQAFSQGSKASFNFSDAETGTFTMQSSKPVVIATYIGTPPPGATRAAGSATELNPVQLPDAVLKSISRASLTGAEVLIR
jgi:hypothetical protein